MLVLSPFTFDQQQLNLLHYNQIEVVLVREKEIAAESLRAGNKRRALIALRQKKYQETLLSQTDSQLETLQKLVRLLSHFLDASILCSCVRRESVKAR